MYRYGANVLSIKLVWSYVKGYAARQYELGRSIQQLTQQTRDGFYGNNATSHQGISSDLCQRLINNCHGWCNQFIQDDTELTGVVDALELNENVNDNEIDIDDDIDNDLDPSTGESSDDECEAE